MAKVIVQMMITAIIEETIETVETKFNPILSSIEGIVISSMDGSQTIIEVEEFDYVAIENLDEDDLED